MPRLKLGEACVAQLVAGRPVQPGTAPGPFQDLIQPGRRQRLAATGALQHHEHLPGRSRCGPFGLQVGLRTALVISARDPSAAQAPSAGAPGDPLRACFAALQSGHDGPGDMRPHQQGQITRMT